MLKNIRSLPLGVWGWRLVMTTPNDRQPDGGIMILRERGGNPQEHGDCRNMCCHDEPLVPLLPAELAQAREYESHGCFIN